MTDALLEREGDLADAEVVERRLRDGARRHIADARASTARCRCGGTPERDDDGRWRCSTCGKRASAPAPDLPRGLRLAINRAVACVGGSDEDARELEAVWRRALRDSERRTAAMLSANRLRHCGCADGGDPDGGGRCSRCNLATGGAA